ncbi:thiamine pyrophosphokinase [Wolfiporia cocos MD-104 SS10]|uniref:Thiamine pyrophosphokinase n=1 Tax=Wolfiporia cocos (strain MD-104) TaxID=742152 RepID=A0A2H3JTN0_WOLCO|nr:thiamine pyrophosphokinase [Wolfiporia cocos MD-104 SS10]
MPDLVRVAATLSATADAPGAMSRTGSTPVSGPSSLSLRRAGVWTMWYKGEKSEAWIAATARVPKRIAHVRVCDAFTRRPISPDRICSTMSTSESVCWTIPFLEPPSTYHAHDRKYALIILNQPFSRALLSRLWTAGAWRCCADGGANRLHDALGSSSGQDARAMYIPNLIKGDLDSLRSDVREYYASQNVPVVQDNDQYSTDLMKCIHALEEHETATGSNTLELIILGGLSGRLDQTVHTLSLLHKLRKGKRRIYVASDDNVAWVLGEGEHSIEINHAVFGPTCGLLPVGIDATVLSTTGLRWNLADTHSSFDTVVSTSNHFVPEERTVWIKTTKPVWWTMEVRAEGLL